MTPHRMAEHDWQEMGRLTPTDPYSSLGHRCARCGASTWTTFHGPAKWDAESYVMRTVSDNCDEEMARRVLGS